MGSIGSQQEPANSEGLGASLVKLVRTGTDKLIISWLGVSGQNLLESFRLSLEIFFVGQAPVITIRHSPQTVIGNPSCHVPVFLIDDEIRVPVPEFVEVIINLPECQYGRACFGRRLTFVAMICFCNVSPG